jgi:hypothetical protein
MNPFYFHKFFPYLMLYAELLQKFKLGHERDGIFLEIYVMPISNLTFKPK